MPAMLIPILLSVGAVNALIPLLIVIILIAAAGASMRGYNIFAVFGISTLIGIGTATGSKLKNPARTLVNPRYSGVGFKGGIKAGKGALKKKIAAHAEAKANKNTMEQALQNTGGAGLSLLSNIKSGGKSIFDEENSIKSNLPDSAAHQRAYDIHSKLLRLGQPGVVSPKALPGAPMRVRLAIRYANAKARLKMSKNAKNQLLSMASASVAAQYGTTLTKRQAKSQAKRLVNKELLKNSGVMEGFIKSRSELLEKEHNELNKKITERINKYNAPNATAKEKEAALRQAMKDVKAFKKNTSSSLWSMAGVAFGKGHNKQLYNYWNNAISSKSPTLGKVVGGAAVVIGAISGYNFVRNEANKEALAKMYRYGGGLSWGSQSSNPNVLQREAENYNINKEQKLQQDEKTSRERVAKDEEESKKRTAQDKEASRERVARDEKESKKKQKKDEEGK